jgi:hypothetical protein
MELRLFIAPGLIKVPTFDKRTCKNPRLVVVEDIGISSLIAIPGLHSRIVGVGFGMSPSFATPTRTVEARESGTKTREEFEYL